MNAYWWGISAVKIFFWLQNLPPGFLTAPHGFPKAFGISPASADFSAVSLNKRLTCRLIGFETIRISGFKKK